MADIWDDVSLMMWDILIEVKLLTQQAILRGDTPPPNAPSTIKRKGHGKTLVDTGLLGHSIQAKLNIEQGNDFISGEVGASGEREDVFRWMEYGVPYSDSLTPVPGQRIPSRSTMRRIWDTKGDEIIGREERKLMDRIERRFKRG